MAILVMLILILALTAAIILSAGGSRDASRTNAGQKAYSLAEAGVNNEIAVLNANYPSTSFPAPTSLCPSGPPCSLATTNTTYNGGSCAAPINNCVTWTATLNGPLTVSNPWRWEWDITSTGKVQNPTGAGAALVTRKVTAVVPIVIPPTVPSGPSGPLNFLYSDTDMTFANSLHVGAAVYATGNLYLQNQAIIESKANKVAVGVNGQTCAVSDLTPPCNSGRLTLTSPQNQIGDSSTTPLPEIHVVNQCSSKAQTAWHACNWATDKIFATVHDNTIPASFLSFTPVLTCCSPEAGSNGHPAAAGTTSNMGFWYLNADLGPLAPCTTSNGTPPIFDTSSGTADNAINLSATPTTAINLTPATSYTCRSQVGNTILGELSWNASTSLLTIKGTIFIDGSIYIAPPSGTARYSGLATIIAAGTFGMKNSTICATHPGYTGACDFSATSPWDPGQSALIIVADGAAPPPGTPSGAQGQGSDFTVGDGIELKNSGYQGALIANNGVRVEASGGTSEMQGPMISVYAEVWAGQSNELIFPPILFSPSGGGGIISQPPPATLLPPQNYGGG